MPVHFSLVFLCMLLSLVPVVKKTLAKHAVLIEFYSDIADPAIPTIDLGSPQHEERSEFIAVLCVFAFVHWGLKNISAAYLKMQCHKYLRS